MFSTSDSSCSLAASFSPLTRISTRRSFMDSAPLLLSISDCPLGVFKKVSLSGMGSLAGYRV